MIFGVDVHPQFQAGLNIEEVAREGFGFLSTKLSEGTSSAYEGMGSADWIRRGKAAGMICFGYHYLDQGNIAGQAQVFAASLARCDVPGVIDAEALAADGRTPTLTIGAIREFYALTTAAGARIPLMYLPSWYWERIGSPDLTGLPGLWASSYPSGAQLPASVLYQNVTPDRWAGYGGRPVEVLQFGDTGLVAGHAIDVNAYQGTPAQFAALTGNPVVLVANKSEGPTMETLPATTPPDDVNSPPATWPERNHLVLWNVAGGWEGGAAFSFAVQDWGGRKTDAARGFLLLASWVMPGGGLAPVDPVFTVAGGGRVINAQTPTQEWAAPSGCVGVTLNYAAPSGACVAVGRSG